MGGNGMGDEQSDRLVGDTHPDADAIQRCADGTADPASERALVDHVQQCEACGKQVERLRRVDAALALSSRPPGDLLTRIKARRAVGERVLLPVPNVGVAPVDHRGERSAARTVVSRGPVKGRNYAWPTAIAAALVCAVSLRLAVQSTVDDTAVSTDATRPVSMAVDPTATPAPAVAAPKTPGALGAETMDRSVPVAPSPSPRQAPPAADVPPHGQLLIRMRSALEGVQVQSDVLTPVRASGDTISTGLVENAFDGSGLTPAGAAAVRALAATLGRLEGYQLTVRAATGGRAQRAGQVRAVVDGLMSGGIERGRIRQGNRPSGSARTGGVVEIDVTVPR